MSIPVAAAKRVSKDTGCPVVVIFGIDAGGDGFSVATYGASKSLCKVAASFGDQIAAAITGGAIKPPATEKEADAAVVRQFESSVQRIESLERTCARLRRIAVTMSPDGLYRIIGMDDRKAIVCLLCGMVSHNPNDVSNHYCGNCKLFLDDFDGEIRTRLGVL